MKTRRWIALLLAALLPLGGALAESTLDYTVAEKLRMQLDAGSGFLGTLTLESVAAAGRESEAVITKTPVVFDVGYLNVRENAARQTAAEKRLTLALKGEDETEPKPALEASLQGGALYVGGELLENGWLALGGDGELLAAARETVGGLPALTSLLPSLLAPSALGGDELDALLAPYLTKIDLWLEGYRQETMMGKTDAGESTMTFRYLIAPPAIKSQLKQLTMDAMNDAALLAAVQPLLPEDVALRYVNPNLLSYYFTAIDDLPLTGDMTLSRTVSLKGDTLRLEIGLPLQDQSAGAMTVSYLRAVGDGDIPAAQEIALQSEREKIVFRYQGYATMTDTTVYQGALSVQPMEGSALSPLNVAFTLTHQVTASMEDEDTDVMTHEMTLRLEPPAADVPETSAAPEETPLATAQPAPAEFEPVELHVTAVFRSRQANDAATYLDATATLTGEGLAQTITATLSGRSSKPWSPSVLDTAAARPFAEMTQPERDALLLGVGAKALALLLPSVTLPASLTAAFQ